MDFTYTFAALLGIVMGFSGSALFVAQKRRSVGRLVFVVFVASVALNMTGLINWAYIGDQSRAFVALDLALITTFTVVGCLIGMAPPLAMRTIWRWVRGRRQ